MRSRTPTRESFMGRVEADEHDLLWLIEAGRVRYQLALVSGRREAAHAHAPPEPPLWLNAGTGGM
jgi:hypothetical protein